MPTTLRRSCTGCAKAKLRCDLSTPQCQRCEKRNRRCEYANEPLTSGAAGRELIQTSNPHKATPESALLLNGSVPEVYPNVPGICTSFDAHLFDPFDSYPTTSLSRLRVQGLMQHCMYSNNGFIELSLTSAVLSKIAFQYYPLDLNPASNPFVASWWPLALQDPLLFHVTLQTASWDDEYRASKERGFPHSEMLMKDSVTLLRRKIQDQFLAFEDATMNAVVTLAAIEVMYALSLKRCEVADGLSMGRGIST